MTDPAGNTGTAATATATLDQTAPSGYTITSDASTYNATTATAAGFTFASAEVGDTYAYTISSSAGGTAVTGSGSVTSATQDVNGINISSLPDGTLTFSVTLTDPAGNTGTAATATATLDQTAPSGYTISSDASTYNATTATAAGFTFASAEVGDTFAYTISSSGGGTALTGSGSVTSATQDVNGINISSLPDGTLTFSVTLTDPAGNTGTAATATATLDQTAPSGYTISSDASTYNATTATSAGFTFADAEVGDTYAYTISSSGGGTALTGSGSVTSATQDVNGINISSLPDGTLTFSVTLTNPAGNPGSAATATATLDQTAPSGYTISSDASTVQRHDGHGGRLHACRRGSGRYVCLHDQQFRRRNGPHRQRQRDLGHPERHGHQRLHVADGTLTFSVTLTNAAGNTGVAATATATLDQTAPSGYTISPTRAPTTPRRPRRPASPSPTPKSGDTYCYTITSSGGGTAVTGSGSVTSATQNVTGINVSALPDGTLTFSVTLTDPAGNTGHDGHGHGHARPDGPQRLHDHVRREPRTTPRPRPRRASPSPTPKWAIPMLTRSPAPAAERPVTGSGSVTSATQNVTGVNVSSLPDGTLTFSVTLDRSGRQHRRGGHGHCHARHDGSERLLQSLPTRAPINATTASSTGFTFADAAVGRHVCLHDQQLRRRNSPSPAAAA